MNVAETLVSQCVDDADLLGLPLLLNLLRYLLIEMVFLLNLDLAGRSEERRVGKECQP